MRKKNNFGKIFNFTNVLLIILIIFVLILIFIVLNKNTDNNYKNIIDDNFSIDVEEYDVSNISLNDFPLMESEFISKIVISSDNFNDVKERYNFLFNKELNNSLGYVTAEINDIILEYKDYIIVYDYENEKVKSIWNIGYIN